MYQKHIPDQWIARVVSICLKDGKLEGSDKAV